VECGKNGIATEAQTSQRESGERANELAEAVGAGAEEFEKVEVPEELELLADFVVDVVVVRVKFG
jgi:hypothetical protein